MSQMIKKVANANICYTYLPVQDLLGAWYRMIFYLVPQCHLKIKKDLQKTSKLVFEMEAPMNRERKVERGKQRLNTGTVSRK